VGKSVGKSFFRQGEILEFGKRLLIRCIVTGNTHSLHDRDRLNLDHKVFPHYRRHTDQSAGWWMFR